VSVGVVTELAWGGSGVAAVREASIRRQRAADAATGVEAPGAAMRALEVSAGMASSSFRLREGARPEGADIYEERGRQKETLEN